MIAISTNAQGVVVPSQALLDAAEELRRGAWVDLLVMTDEMAPYLRCGWDAVSLQGGRTPQVGQLVLAAADVGWVLSRVVDIDRERVTLRSEQHASLPVHCALPDVLGVVQGAYDVLTGKPRRTGAFLYRLPAPLRTLLRRCFRA